MGLFIYHYFLVVTFRRSQLSSLTRSKVIGSWWRWASGTMGLRKQLPLVQEKRTGGTAELMGVPRNRAGEADLIEDSLTEKYWWHCRPQGTNLR